jgi:hypothetical protein
MALPLSRDTSYAPGSQVFSADLNNLQDSIISGAHGPKVVLVGPQLAGLVTATYSGDYVTIDSDPERADFPIVLPQGAILEAVTVFGENIGAPTNEVDGTIREIAFSNYAVATQTLSTTKGAGTSNGEWTLAWTSADTDIPYTVPASDVAYQVRIQTTGAVGVTVRVYGMTYQYYVPV